MRICGTRRWRAPPSLRSSERAKAAPPGGVSNGSVLPAAKARPRNYRHRQRMLARASRRSIARPDRTATRTLVLHRSPHRMPHRQGSPDTPSWRGSRSQQGMSSSIRCPGSSAACWHSDNQARINRKALTADQASCNTGFNDTLENPAEHIALTEPLMADA